MPHAISNIMWAVSVKNSASTQGLMPALSVYCSSSWCDKWYCKLFVCLQPKQTPTHPAEKSSSEFAVTTAHQTNLLLTANTQLPKQLGFLPVKEVTQNTSSNISWARSGWTKDGSRKLSRTLSQQEHLRCSGSQHAEPTRYQRTRGRTWTSHPAVWFGVCCDRHARTPWRDVLH